MEGRVEAQALSPPSAHLPSRKFERAEQPNASLLPIDAKLLREFWTLKEVNCLPAASVPKDDVDYAVVHGGCYWGPARRHPSRLGRSFSAQEFNTNLLERCVAFGLEIHDWRLEAAPAAFRRRRPLTQLLCSSFGCGGSGGGGCLEAGASAAAAATCECKQHGGGRLEAMDRRVHGGRLLRSLSKEYTHVLPEVLSLLTVPAASASSSSVGFPPTASPDRHQLLGNLDLQQEEEEGEEEEQEEENNNNNSAAAAADLQDHHHYHHHYQQQGQQGGTSIPATGRAGGGDGSSGGRCDVAAPCLGSLGRLSSLDSAALHLLDRALSGSSYTTITTTTIRGSQPGGISNQQQEPPQQEQQPLAPAPPPPSHGSSFSRCNSSLFEFAEEQASLAAAAAAQHSSIAGRYFGGGGSFRYNHHCHQLVDQPPQGAEYLLALPGANSSAWAAATSAEELRSGDGHAVVAAVAAGGGGACAAAAAAVAARASIFQSSVNPCSQSSAAIPHPPPSAVSQAALLGAGSTRGSGSAPAVAAGGAVWHADKGYSSLPLPLRSSSRLFPLAGGGVGGGDGLGKYLGVDRHPSGDSGNDGGNCGGGSATAPSARNLGGNLGGNPLLAAPDMRLFPFSSPEEFYMAAAVLLEARLPGGFESGGEPGGESPPVKEVK
ncbi:hypothetical protein VOLCADRAFT_99150 [Volvox carteri f. nagariensis]|nr:uncharacterized protein VOLCADRAFT_99150 [Volvox carteri f. nagariensis]EFJ41006.1 hypothetical protein VOLCADRAFT_99150 [Volvox carteri f. nagariensis]|eukprot:XP_002957980.1 hypothetical protein VOLCADRAFT_99150 [Volvox carteri f. nagariensis]